MGRSHKRNKSLPNITQTNINIAPARLNPLDNYENKHGYKLYMVPQGYQPVLLPLEYKDDIAYLNKEAIKLNQHYEVQQKFNQQKIKRPLNSFLLYRKDKIEEIKKNFPNVNNSMISNLAGKMWKAETNEVRIYYQNLAKKEKLEHSLRFPNYKFCPKRNPPKPKASSTLKAKKNASSLPKTDTFDQNFISSPSNIDVVNCCSISLFNTDGSSTSLINNNVDNNYTLLSKFASKSLSPINHSFTKKNSAIISNVMPTDPSISNIGICNNYIGNVNVELINTSNNHNNNITNECDNYGYPTIDNELNPPSNDMLYPCNKFVDTNNNNIITGTLQHPDVQSILNQPSDQNMTMTTNINNSLNWDSYNTYYPLFYQCFNNFQNQHCITPLYFDQNHPVDLNFNENPNNFLDYL